MKIRRVVLLALALLWFIACMPMQALVATPTTTPEPYWQYTIDYLRGRTYGDGQLEIVQTLSEEDAITHYLVHYPSDGLDIYSILSVPTGTGLFPVIVAIHGYADPGQFNLIDNNDGMDLLTKQGYIVLYPALRNYSPSSKGDNLFRVGMAIDILNLIALIKSQGGQPGPLENADSSRIGLWGYSMGGGVILRMLTITSDVKAAVLYSPASGDESKNAPLFHNLSTYTQDAQFTGELDVPASALINISPSHYYSNITSPLLIFHGTKDTVVPVEWTRETCGLLAAAGKNVNCIYYSGADHSFLSHYLKDYFARMYEFYRTYLGQ